MFSPRLLSSSAFLFVLLQFAITEVSSVDLSWNKSTNCTTLDTPYKGHPLLHSHNPRNPYKRHPSPHHTPHKRHPSPHKRHPSPHHTPHKRHPSPQSPNPPPPPPPPPHVANPSPYTPNPPPPPPHTPNPPPCTPNPSPHAPSKNNSSCRTGNLIDDCWRCDPEWEKNRQNVASCAIGFGKDAIGGRGGKIYVVTDPENDDPVTPNPGTLRYAVIQTEPLWIIFERDMVITLKDELIMNSYKTIDGRGVEVHIAGGPCITIQYVSHIIIHGVHVHDCVPGGNAMVRSSPTHYGRRGISDGDGISLFGANNVWIDHCSLRNCTDGLIDAIMNSTAITISNNHFSHHDEVMLMGHSDEEENQMQVTVAFNHFGEGLVQRMPRCRRGYFHLVNNDYIHWKMYAVGGSVDATINSQGNRYVASSAKEVTKRMSTPENVWKNWNWRTQGDLFLNGAFFTPSGSNLSTAYAKATSIPARPASMVPSLTKDAGALNCKSGSIC